MLEKEVSTLKKDKHTLQQANFTLTLKVGKLKSELTFAENQNMVLQEEKEDLEERLQQ